MSTSIRTAPIDLTPAEVEQKAQAIAQNVLRMRPVGARAAQIIASAEQVEASEQHLDLLVQRFETTDDIASKLRLAADVIDSVVRDVRKLIHESSPCVADAEAATSVDPATIVGSTSDIRSCADAGVRAGADSPGTHTTKAVTS